MGKLIEMPLREAKLQTSKQGKLLIHSEVWWATRLFLLQTANAFLGK